MLVYLQADEIYPAPLRSSGRAPRGCARVRRLCELLELVRHRRRERVPDAVRPRISGRGIVVSIGDGFSFDLGDLPVERSPEEILHYGWCFPVNILRKHVSHAASTAKPGVPRARRARRRDAASRLRRPAPARRARAGVSAGPLRRRAPAGGAAPCCDDGVRPRARARATRARRGLVGPPGLIENVARDARPVRTQTRPHELARVPRDALAASAGREAGANSFRERRGSSGGTTSARRRPASTRCAALAGRREDTTGRPAAMKSISFDGTKSANVGCFESVHEQGVARRKQRRHVLERHLRQEVDIRRGRGCRPCDQRARAPGRRR